jgi:hypothetical protein
LNLQEVAHVAYSIGNDSTDEPAIFFHIILTDEASREDCLADVTWRVASTLSSLIRPVETLGPNALFQFSQPLGAENAKRPRVVVVERGLPR